MKIGIITLQAADTFENVLQTYILQRFLEQAGHETEVIDYCPTSISMRNQQLNMKLRHREKQYNLFRQKLVRTERITSKVALEQCNGKYDLLIAAGNDIFDGVLTKGIKTGFFLSFDTGAKKAACAISMQRNHNHPLELEVFAKHLSKFCFFGACDSVIASRFPEGLQATRCLQRNLFLLADPAELLQFTSKKKNQKGRPYIFLYANGGEWMVRKVADKLASMTELPLVHNYARTKLSNQLFNCTEYAPDCYPSFVAGADYVVTNSVDVAILAMMYGRKFLLIPVGRNKERLLTLSKDYGLQNQTIMKAELFQNIEQTNVEYEVVHSILASEQKQIRESIHTLIKTDSLRSGE